MSTTEVLDFATGVAAYRVDDATLNRFTMNSLGPAVCDLVEVIEAVATADRLVRRPPSNLAGDSWSRSLHVVVGVRDKNRWDLLAENLSKVLGRLTDDRWVFEFVARKGPPRYGEAAETLFSIEPNLESVALFSGGLDSLCGVALEARSDRTLGLVSVASNTRLGAAQSRLADQLGVHGRVELVKVGAHLRSVAESRESSQRSRGFVFLGLGAIVAHLAGLSELRVYENGVGAFNLAMSRAQVGAHTTKSMHPGTLRAMSSLAGQALDAELSIVNPHEFRTKAEMCGLLPEWAHRLVPLALSCDTAYAHRASKVPNCGSCTSCLLRRQSLLAAGLGDLDASTTYREDAFLGTIDEAPDTLKVMISQAASIDRCLDGPAPWRSLVSRFPELHASGASLASEDQTLLMAMYRRYVSEWKRLDLPAGRPYFQQANSEAMAA